MSSDAALKRARRARERQRAGRRQQQLRLIESSPAAQARRAAGTPIQLCLLHGELSDGAVEGGVASVVLARGQTPNQVTAAVFLVDTLCLGIKDVFIRDLDADAIEEMVQGMAQSAPLAEVDPALARRFLREAAAWAAPFGFKPHRDFIGVEQIFGDISADDSDAAFVFGVNGKPYYVPGPTESRAQVRRRFAQVIEILGPEASLEYAATMAEWLEE